MLSYIARTVPRALWATFRADGSVVSRISARVSPRQIDINMHMNQAAYAQVMELGRTDWFLRSGAWQRWRAAGANPMVASQTLTYRRELKPLQKYTVQTKAVGTDGRMLELECLMLVGDRVHTRGDVKVLFAGPDGVHSAETVQQLATGFLTEPSQIENWRLIG